MSSSQQQQNGGSDTSGTYGKILKLYKWATAADLEKKYSNLVGR
jgi:hypothetical protein